MADSGELVEGREWGNIDSEAIWEGLGLELLRVNEGIHGLTDLGNEVSEWGSNAADDGWLTPKEVHAYTGK